MITLFYILRFRSIAKLWQLGTQDPATPIMEGMIFFQNYLVFYIIVTKNSFRAYSASVKIIEFFNSNLNKYKFYVF